MKYYGLSAVALIALVMVGCNGSSKGGDYTIEGKATNPKLEGRTVYLQDALTGQTRYDSAKIANGVFHFSGKQDTIIVRELLVQENDSDMYPVTLPVVLESGEIKVSLGDNIYVDNTPLNKELMKVLLAIDGFHNQDFTGKTMEEIKAVFTGLLMEQIVKNSNSPIGKYLYEAYLSKLTDTQQTEAKKVLGL